MAKKVYTVAILGIGGRGGDTYGALMQDGPKNGTSSRFAT